MNALVVPVKVENSNGQASLFCFSIQRGYYFCDVGHGDSLTEFWWLLDGQFTADWTKTSKNNTCATKKNEYTEEPNLGKIMKRYALVYYCWNEIHKVVLPSNRKKTAKNFEVVNFQTGNVITENIKGDVTKNNTTILVSIFQKCE